MNNEFNIKGLDFCCTTVALKRVLDGHGFKIRSQSFMKSDPVRRIWFYEMCDEMIPVLRAYFNKTIVWDKTVE